MKATLLYYCQGLVLLYVWLSRLSCQGVPCMYQVNLVLASLSIRCDRGFTHAQQVKCMAGSLTLVNHLTPHTRHRSHI